MTNQAGYTRATGKPCPAYNPTFPIKTWFDNRKFTSPQNTVDYLTARYDPSGQVPSLYPFSLSAAVAASVNIPPDSGPIPPSSAGEYDVPCRDLLPSEILYPREGALIDVINTNVFDPDPARTAVLLLKKIMAFLKMK